MAGLVGISPPRCGGVDRTFGDHGSAAAGKAIDRQVDPRESKQMIGRRLSG
jgi:hypothetical protein